MLVFLGLSVLDLGPMYATDRQTSVRETSGRRHTASSLNAPRRRRNKTHAPENSWMDDYKRL